MLASVRSIRLRLAVIMLCLSALVVASTLTGLHALNVTIENQQSLDLVGNHQTEAYRLAILAEQLEGASNGNSDTEAQAFVKLLNEGIANYDQTQRILNQRLMGKSQVLSVLSEVERRWVSYRTLLLQYLDADPKNRNELVDTIDRQATILYSFTRRVVSALQLETQDTNANAQRAFIIIFAVTLISLSGSVVVLHQTNRAINGLSVAARTLASGDYSVRAQASNLAEIAAVGHAFNDMADTVQQRETDLKQLNATLELRVDERTKDLRKANALAQESVRLKSEFMSTMSHELRTPLNAIIGFCGIMLEGMGGEIDDDARHMLERVNGNSTRLLSLINEVLDLAKIEAGRLELVSEPMSVRALVERWRSQTAVLAEQKGLSFNVEIDPRLPEKLYGDPERLTQIAVNLLSNAFKFTEKGGVNLVLGRLDGAWLIQVSDTGIGIPPHAINYIFDEFRQVDGSSRRMYGGSGLGLSIVRHLSRMMNGSVSVTSDLGKGSVFTVKLPLVAVEAVETETPVLEMAQA